MAKYYLDLIAKVDNIKATQQTTKPGDIVQWKAPKLPPEFIPKTAEAEPAPAPKALKVERKKSFRELGVTAQQVSGGNHYLLGKDDGELHLSGQTYQYPGDAWHIELPSGEIIEYNDSNLTGTPAGPQTCGIRFKADASKGSASLENIRAQLETMGLPLHEATTDDMELLYWRHLAGVLSSRKDAYAGKHKNVWTVLHEGMTEHGLVPEAASKEGEKRNVAALAAAKLEPADEIALWRKAWSELTSKEQVDAWADEGGFYPHLKHWDVTAPEVTNGLPGWYRFDATPEWVNSVHNLSHNFKYPSRDALLITRTGGGLSTEARIRALGTYISGQSSSGDMTMHGSSGVFYLNPPSSAGSGGGLAVNPKVLAQTQTYGFNNDAWGDINERDYKSLFDLAGASGHTTETVPKDGVSLLDDIELVRAENETQRLQIIKELKDKGITEIRGLPVGDRVAASSGWSTALNKVRAHYKTLDPLKRDEPYVAPPQEKVSVEHAMITTEAEAAAAEGGDLAKAVAGKTASAVHTAAVPASKVASLLFGQPTKPAASEAVSSKVKNDVAKRLSVKMTSGDDALKALYADAGKTVPADWGDDDRQRAVALLVNLWAASNTSPLATATQDAARDLFGMAPATVLDALPTGHGTDQAAADAFRAKHTAVLEDFLRSQWDLTQQDLSEAGIDHVRLYRIMKWNAGDVPAWAKGHAVGDVIEAPPGRPIVPWGFMKGGATGAGTFGSGSHTIVVSETVPRELILSYPKSGMGCYNETEMVTMTAPGQWEIIKETGL